MRLIANSHHFRATCRSSQGEFAAHITLTYDAHVELKTARLTLLIDPAKKLAFEKLCAALDLTPSQVVRQMIRDYLAAHGVSYMPSGAELGKPAARPAKAAPSRTASSRAAAPQRRKRQ